MELRRGAAGVIRVGHRGAAALAPENSLAAIEAAAAHELDVVELDVRPTAAGGLVLAHAPELSPDAPSLDSALELAAHLGLAVQLDVKVRGIERALAESLSRHDLVARSFVSSFSLPTLRAFARAAPDLTRSVTYPDDRFGLSGRRLLRPAARPGLAALRAALPHRLPRWLRATGARAATLNWVVVTPEAVAATHAAGAALYVWTVNEPALAATLIASGVDGIITDDPRILPRGISSRT